MSIKDKLKKMFKTQTLQNIAKMLTGTVVGQIVSTVMVPIASRIYGAELYGDLAVFTSAMSLCTSFLGFGLASAIMVEDTDQKAQQTYKLAVYGTDLLVIAIAAFMIILSPYVRVINTSLPYVNAIFMLVFAVTTTNQINMLYAWLNRKGKYNVLLLNPIITPLVNNGLVIALGVMGYTGFGLYAGLLVSQGVTLLHMYVKMDKMETRLCLRDIPDVVKRNKDFILYQYPSTLVNGVVGNLPVQIISNFFGNTVVGYYSMAMKLLNIPAGLLGNSVSRVYFKEVSEKQKNGKSARKYTLKVSKILIIIFMIPVVGILLLGDELIPWLLGSEWIYSVPYIKIMAYWNLFAIAVNCTSGFTSVIHKQKSNMILAIIKLISFPTFMIGLSVVFHNSLLTVMTYATIYSIINVVYYEKLIREEKELKYKYLGINLVALLICAFVNAMGTLIRTVV